LKELETREKVTEKVDELTVFGGLEGVLKDVVRIQARELNSNDRWKGSPAGWSGSHCLYVFDLDEVWMTWVMRV
jgi:hypothetical protein